MDRLESEFAKFRDGGIDYFERLVDAQVEESEILDFKRSDQSKERDSLGKSDKENLSKAISGFGNSFGGVLVWGVDCRPKPGGPDVVQSLHPIPELRSFYTRLQSLIGQVVNPPPEGIEFSVVESAPDQGFVVMYIPKSQSLVKATASGTCQYYYRSGSSFYEMDHATLRRRFLEEARGELKLLQGAEERELYLSLMQKVELYWLNFVLDESLRGKVQLEQSLTERIDLLEHPWGAPNNDSKNSEVRLPPGTLASEILTQLCNPRTLLIVGEQGAGKTVVLLQLARTLIKRYGKHSADVPVILHLAFWTGKEVSFYAWLCAEMASKYGVSKSDTAKLLKVGHIVILIDGLDHLSADVRAGCIEHINYFTRQQPNVGMVLTCRTFQYQKLSTKLRFQRAVEISPLDADQILGYVAAHSSVAIAHRISEEPGLAKLVRTPYMLEKLCEAAAELPPLPIGSTTVELRAAVLDAYLKSALKGNTKFEVSPQHYSAENTRLWLTNLAQNMSSNLENGNPVFFRPEGMQPGNWVDTPKSGIYYFAPFVIPIACVSYPLLFRYPFEGDLRIVMVWFTLIFMPVVGAVFTSFIKPVPGLRLNVPAVKEYFMKSVAGRVLALLQFIRDGWLFLLVVIGIPAIIGSIIMGALSLFHVHTDTWPKWLEIPSVVAVLIWFAPLLIAVLAFQFGLVFLIAGVTLYPLLLLPFWLLGPDYDVSTAPNKLIWRSLLSGVINGAIVALCWYGAVQFLPHKDFSEYLLLGYVFGFLIAGGGAFILHFWLRTALAASGRLPWNLIGFLDYAIDRGLMQQIGPRYMFSHSLLQEHLAGTKIQEKDNDAP